VGTKYEVACFFCASQDLETAILQINKLRLILVNMDNLHINRFEQRTFIETWIDAFHENFQAYVKDYLSVTS